MSQRTGRMRCLRQGAVGSPRTQDSLSPLGDDTCLTWLQEPPPPAMGVPGPRGAPGRSPRQSPRQGAAPPPFPAAEPWQSGSGPASTPLAMQPPPSSPEISAPSLPPAADFRMSPPEGGHPPHGEAADGPAHAEGGGYAVDPEDGGYAAADPEGGGYSPSGGSYTAADPEGGSHAAGPEQAAPVAAAEAGKGSWEADAGGEAEIAGAAAATAGESAQEYTVRLCQQQRTCGVRTHCFSGCGAQCAEVFRGTCKALTTPSGYHRQ